MKLVGRTVTARCGGRSMEMIILKPERQDGPLPGILWIHGGGYRLGMAGMVHASCAKLLAKKFGAVVIAPEYRLAGGSGGAPYPAALRDCHAALRFLYANAEKLGIRPDRIIVGGESAGGGLAAALCLYERDRGGIPVAYQLPLYPMLDCEDTDSSRDNHGRVWNTKRNHWGWQGYLGRLYGTDRVPKYASPARETDLTGMPPAYTFVSAGEPFRDETLTYIRRLREAGTDAFADVYPGNVHAFDMLLPWTKNARAAKRRLCGVYASVLRAWEREDAAEAADTAEAETKAANAAAGE
ncbi:MAG: alpha/beta hydrolase [Lachnospiraceae bacterium]|nr:alpha/beta hydrolase [Lachnospiraceae bacterium]